LREWEKFAREVRTDADALTERIVSMARQVPDLADAARARS
jgi:serine/threonine-protein kinase HipA